MQQRPGKYKYNGKFSGNDMASYSIGETTGFEIRTRDIRTPSPPPPPPAKRAAVMLSPSVTEIHCSLLHYTGRGTFEPYVTVL